MSAIRLLLPAALLLVPLAISGRAPEPPVQPMPRRGAAHPSVDRAETCDGCHATVTPAVTAAWKRSRHAETGVTCSACHGLPGADFVPRPAASVCESCHREETSTVAADPGSAGKSCFTCHPPHALGPHRRRDAPR